ncbi:MAG: alpha/beta fold hydrolase [Steroidobacteraceae bacterium]
MLRWLRRIAIAIGILIIVGVVSLLIGFGFWRSGIERELLAKSSVVMTARGPVEYAQIGHGPAVLVIHGTPGGYDLWLNTFEAMHAAKDGFRYILPSRPGYLRTPLGDGATPAEQADVLVALLDALHIGRAAVIGVSGGGPAALQFAIRHPDRCTALVLEEAVVRRLSEQLPNLPRGAFAAGFRDFEIYLMYEAAGLYGLNPQYAQVMAVARAQLSASAPYALRKAGVLNDLTQEGQIGNWPLSQIHCPTLILQGTADQNVPPADARYAHAQIAGSQLREFPGADHLMVIFRSRQLRSIIVSFLRAHPETHPAPVLVR